MAINRKHLKLNGSNKQSFADWLKESGFRHGLNLTDLAKGERLKPVTLRSYLSKGRIQQQLAVRLARLVGGEEITAEHLQRAFNLTWTAERRPRKATTASNSNDLLSAFSALEKERKRADKHLEPLGHKAQELIDSMNEGDLAIFIGMDVLPWAFDVSCHPHGQAHMTSIAKAVLRGCDQLYIQPNSTYVRLLKKLWQLVLSTQVERLHSLFEELQNGLEKTLVQEFKKSARQAESLVQQHLDQYLIDGFPYFQPGLAIIVFVTQRSEDQETIIRVMVRMPGDKRTQPIFLPYWAPYCRDLKNAISCVLTKESTKLVKALRTSKTKKQRDGLGLRLEKVQRVQSKLLMLNGN